MDEFSDESALVAENWNAVLDIIRARERLDDELTELLFSVGPYLEELEWWDQGWQFWTYKKEVYIRNSNWLNEDGYVVLWIGAYNFDAAHVFGLASPPQFYARTRKDCQDLQQILTEKTKAAGHEVTEGHRHFIRRDILKCATQRQAVEEYPNLVREQLTDLFSEYANLLMQFDETIRQYIQEMESSA